MHFKSKPRGTFPLGSCLNSCWLTHSVLVSSTERLWGMLPVSWPAVSLFSRFCFLSKSGILGTQQILAALQGRSVQDFQIPCPQQSRNQGISDAPLPLLPSHCMGWKGRNKQAPASMANPEAFEIGRPHFLIFPSPNFLKSASQYFSDGCSVKSLAIIFQCSVELKQKCWFSKSSVMGIDCSLFLPLVWKASELSLER